MKDTKQKLLELLSDMLAGKLMMMEAAQKLSAILSGMGDAQAFARGHVELITEERDKYKKISEERWKRIEGLNNQVVSLTNRVQLSMMERDRLRKQIESEQDQMGNEWEQIRKQLVLARNRKGHTQSEVGKAIGISAQTISRIESGEYENGKRMRNKEAILKEIKAYCDE